MGDAELAQRMTTGTRTAREETTAREAREEFTVGGARAEPPVGIPLRMSKVESREGGAMVLTWQTRVATN